MKKRNLFACLLSVAALSIVACDKTKENSSTVTDQQKADVESVQFVTSLTSVSPGTYTLEAKALPENADQRIKFTLVSMIEGVSLTDNVLTIGLAVEDGAIVKVKAASVYDPSKSATLQVVVDNQGVEQVEISTEEQLRSINTVADGLNKSYVLKNDITLTQPWDPIGVADVENDDGSVTTGTYFNGIFDGAGYSIKNIQIDQSASGFNVGFFAQTGSSAVIQNVGFEGALSARGWSGGIAGINGGRIQNCIADVDVTVAGGSAGALVSVNRGTLASCYAIGELSCSLDTNTARSAGLVAANEGTITQCYGDIDQLKYDNYTAFEPTKNDTYMLSTKDMMTASTFASWDSDIWYLADGFYPLLKHEGFTAPTQKEIILNFTDSITEIDVENLSDMTYTPSVEAVNGDDTTTLTYSLKEPVTGVSISPTTGELTFTNEVVHLSTITVVVSLADDATITREKTYTLIYNPVPEGDIVEIDSEEDLISLATTTSADALDKDYVVTSDIELTGWYSYTIGSVDLPFTGTFDGRGHTISGFKGGGDPAMSNFGMFGCIAEGAVVENFALYGITERNTDLYVSFVSGVLAGINYGTIQNIYTNVRIMCTSVWVGGLVGRNCGVIANVISENTTTVNETTDSYGPGIAIASCNEEETIFGTVNDVFVSKAKGSTQAYYVANSEIDAVIMVEEDALKSAATYANFDPSIWNIIEGQVPTLIIQTN